MQQLCSRLWSPKSRFHPGQLAWNRYSSAVPDPARPKPGEAISIWRSGEQVVGFGWAEAPDWLELQVDPDHPHVATEVVEWFEDWSDADSQSALVMEGDAAEQALAAAGFEPQRADWFFTHHLLDLTGPALLSAPVAGYRVRPVAPDEAAPRAACHTAAWADVSPSEVTPSSYRAVMAVWPYRHDLDWVAVDEDDRMVASALAWLDPDLGVGLLEPVGCTPDHRGRGLAAAVTAAALRRLRDVGAHTALVSPRGDDDYPGPRRLYRSLGFRPTARTVTWTRTLD